MAYELPGFRIGQLAADVDLSAFTQTAAGYVYTYQFAPIWVAPAVYIVGHGVGGAAVQPYTFTGPSGTITQTAPPIGVLQNPARQKEACNIVISGVTKIVAGGSWIVGDPIGWDNTGKAIKAVTTKYAFATALETGTAGTLSTVLMWPRGVQ